jgi:3-dehydroquinate synthase
METTTRELKVRPGPGREYPILIGNGILRKLPEHIRRISGSCRVLVVTDKNVGRFHLKPVMKNLSGAGIDAEAEELPVGERYKNFGSYQKIVRRLAGLDDARDLIVVAFGGGVVGDLAGFAAATYRRGIPLIQAPTTLLACVDSSVGGKTGFDLPQGKNLVGSFYQPNLVLIDLDTLKTLPAHEFQSGMAEVIKYGLILDERFFARLEREIVMLPAHDSAPLAAAVERCCAIKAKVVGRDERDTKGVRAMLNFGHTFAHAIEAACGYATYSHGEAVAVGMICAAELSARSGYLKSNDLERIERLIEKAGLPNKIKGSTADELIEYMQRDKKTRTGKLRFILLERIGRAFVSDAPPLKDIRAVLKKRIVSF